MEINRFVISRMRQIAKAQNDSTYYNHYYRFLYFYVQLLFSHATNPWDERLILGQDWYLEYCIEGDLLFILDWASVPNDQVFLQVCEMKQAFQQIFSSNGVKYAFASMRHSTSYAFYQRALKFQLVQTLNEELCLDYFIPKSLEQKIDAYRDISEFLQFVGDDLSFEDGFYIFHEIEFCVTDRFLRRKKRKK